MALRVRKANTIDYPGRFLFYGDSGSGKTHLAMLSHLVEGMGPALLVPCDGGESTARMLDIPVVEFEGAKTVNAVIRAAKRGDFPYPTVILDGFSMFYDVLVYGHSGGEVPQIQHWMRASSDVKRMMQDFVRQRKNIIVTCLAQRIQEESTGILYTVPLLPGKMSWRFAEAFDIVGYCSSKGKPTEVRWQLQVQPFRRIVAKDRGNTIGKAVIDVTYTLGDVHDKPNPMEVIWRRWTAHKTGQAPPEDVELGVPDEDDLKLHEEGGSDEAETIPLY